MTNQIRALREQRGLTMKQLGALVGRAESTISQYETGKREPDHETLLRLADQLQVSLDQLLGRNEPARVMFEGREYRTTGRWIPVLGSVPAGIPVEAVEDITDYEELPPNMAGDYIGLTIRGSSMEPKISDGDVVIVRLQEDVESGDIAVVMIGNEEATCKKIKKTPEGIMLIPTNPDFEPWFYSNDEILRRPVRILGKVVELRAKFR